MLLASCYLAPPREVKEEMRLDVVYKRGQLATSRKNAAVW
jgi:hypothetical protein